ESPPSTSHSSSRPTSSPTSAADPPPPHPRRVSQHLRAIGSEHSSPTSSLRGPRPVFHFADVSSPGSITPPPLPPSTANSATTNARPRFGENWNYSSERTFQLNVVPDSLWQPTLAPGKFVAVCREAPRVVANIIGLLFGAYEVLSFCHASKEMRKLVESLFEGNDLVRDAFLVRTIRGFQPSKSPNPTWLNHGIKIDLTDLELLLESESVSLSAYPMHALRVIASHNSQASTSSSVTSEKENTTSRFQTLTLSHSRFVAYLRHRTTPQALQLAFQDEDDAILSSPDDSLGGAQGELVFPSPLFYFNGVEKPVVPAYLPLPTTEKRESRSHSRSVSKGTKDKPLPRLSKSKSASNMNDRNVPELASTAPSSSGRLKRLSLKPSKRKGSVSSPPPPMPSTLPPLPHTAHQQQSSPPSIGQFGTLGPSAGYSMSQSLDSRMRSHSQASMTSPSVPFPSASLSPATFSHSFHSNHGRFTPPMSGQFTPPHPPPSSFGWATPPGQYTPPSSSHRRKNRQSLHAGSDSPFSTGRFRNSQYLNRSMPMLPPSMMPGMPTMINGFDSPAPVTSLGDIHSLSQVFRLTRAPIFRVFVPCSFLNGSILKACVTQLQAASLLPHLRAGDLVCNLGYVPDEDVIANGGENNGDARGWMVWSGHELLPLSTKEVIP
ncbi:3853_t:CDS:2, partial [Acaulospora colombiana]